MSMRNWEILAVLAMIGVLLVMPIAAFGYQSFREAQEGPGMGARPASVVVQTGDTASGSRVFANKCGACHGDAGQGSAAGPDITHMQVGAQFVYTWILDPAGVTPIATMPRLGLTEKEAVDVTAFVMSLKDGKAPVIAAPAQQAAAASSDKPAPSTGGAAQASPSKAGGDAAKGKILFTGKACVGCHGPEGKGTAAGPSIVGVSADAVKTQLRTPKSKMPAFGPGQVSDSDLEDLVAFLSTLK